MKKALSVIALATLMGVAPAIASSVPSSVIVVLRDDVADPGVVAAEHAGSAAADISFVYRHALKGYAARLSPAGLASVSADPRVAYVSPDGVVSASTTQTGATWGLDRTDQRALPLSGTYSYGATGAGVTSYIIDTGIRTTHSEFGGRASWGTDAVDGTRTDCNGHGTHVAGTVGGSTYGMAKAVTLIAVRVLNCDGDGTNSGVIAGIDWVTAHHTSGPAVANMSLGGGGNTALDDAVRNSISDGITYAVAAGNGDLLGNPYDACSDSPGRTPEAITVGATQSNDRAASFSNYGNCVDFFGPGVSITSSWSTSDSATNTISGTSMATPHVAGAAALYLQAVPSASPTSVRDALYAATTKSIVTQSNTANNHLLYVEQAPSLTLSRNAIAFGAARTGTTTSAESVTITNTGASPVTMTSAIVSGANAAEFQKTADTCSGASLGVGATCKVWTAFAPHSTGARAATLNISSGAVGSPHAVALSGAGTAPAIAANPGSVAFGDQGTGVTSSPRQVVVSNPGTAPLAIGTISFSGAHATDFVLTGDNCSGATLAPSATCQQVITFRPGAVGARTASLSIPSDAGPPLSIALSGNGVTPVPGAQVSPTSIAFGDRPSGTTSTPRQVVVTSSGTAPLSVGTVSISGTFVISSDACSGATIAPGDSCAIATSFAPASPGASTGQVSIPINAPSGTATVSLSGNGTPPAPEVRMSPGSLSFAARPAGSSSAPLQVGVTNTGSATLVVGTLSVAGDSDFVKTSDTCSGVSVAPSGTCSFAVVFTPSTFGTRSAAMLFPTNATLGPDRASLSGVGLAGSAQISPSSVTFGTVSLGSASQPAELRVTNVGNATLSLGAAQMSGSNAGDFIRSADLCGGANLSPATSCTVSVSFKPSAAGARSASLTYPSGGVGGAVVASFTGSGLGDSMAPKSSWNTRDMDVRVGSLTTVSGSVTDDVSGIDRVTVTFTPTTGSSAVAVATLGCSTLTSCGFTANVPLLPGVYRVTAVGRDIAGNVESPGAQITIIVV